MALRLRGRYSYLRRIQMLAIRMLLSVISVAKNFDFQSVGVGNMSPIGGFVAHSLTAVLGTSDLLHVSCYSPSVVATLDAQRSEDRIALVWKFFRMKLMFPRAAPFCNSRPASRLEFAP